MLNQNYETKAVVYEPKIRITPMQVEIVERPTQKLFSAHQAHQYLVLDGDLRGDTLLRAEVDDLVEATRAAVQAHLDKPILKQTLKAYLETFNTGVQLPGPVQEIKSITYLDNNGERQQLPEDIYYVSRNGILSLNPGKQLPVILRRDDSVQITYVAGADSVSPDIIQAARLLLTHFFENRTAVSQNSVNELPLGVQYLLANYRHLGI